MRLGYYCLALVIIGCGGGGGGGGGGSAIVNTTTSVTPVDIGGSVGDGPVTGATVRIYNKNGVQIAAVLSDNTATYKTSVKVKGSEYPLVLEVDDGTDLVTGGAPDFKLLSVMMNPSNKVVNINPASTLIVMIAEAMPGGLGSANVATTTAYVTGRLGFGLDPIMFSSPITTPINEDNIANIVKSSEALGEMVRRTRDQMTAAGTVISGDDVMQAIAADMTDGYLDGSGAAGTNPAVAAVANVVSSQVLVEALSNNLRVGGVIATDIIDQAIATTRSQILSSQLTGSVRITPGMLQQARVSLSAAQVIDSSSQISALASTIDSLNGDSLPGDIAPVLPADSYILLDNAVVLASIASDEDIIAINQAVHNTNGTGGGGTVNTAPVISGSPAGSVTANVPYSFLPGSADADGDQLTFSIGNKPAWANFDATTGRLSGTPAGNDVMTYSGIVISVTDGTDTVSLPVFSIRVNAAPVGNTAPVISGSPAGSVTANALYSFLPGATDADGDQLTFSIGNKPAWANFDVTTGRLSGTPANSDAGTYSNIVISVTDSMDTISLGAFTIQVTTVVLTGSFNLSWTAPVARSDGTPLSLADISGYRLYYGTSPGIYPDVLVVSDATATSVTVAGVPLGTHHVVMTTYDVGGRESVYSPEISKTAQ